MRNLFFVLFILLSNVLFSQNIEGTISGLSESGDFMLIIVDLEEGKYKNLNRLVDKACDVKVELAGKKDVLALAGKGSVKTASENRIMIYLNKSKIKYDDINSEGKIALIFEKTKKKKSK